ncbi:GGDEF domain-containing protein [Rubrivivax gelatinosus]|uniref:diguanylate cyclase n=1 Tax=Rubrivivax gelatinosus TaxID=28068 RepID=A0ABS1DX04_RUBGE|nr:GGDEF domain-containing protein [Rubrivivax gelatinosus]MBK1615677.1 GGDEF domain-containing protein [Rubrivivax gelatinosus]MBK1714552.1 GGDEF domain-containing protein [Rubrivivax gelatinosus]
MTLHPPTILVLLLLGYAMLGLQLAMVRRRLHGSEALRRWSWGNSLLLLGHLMLLARVVVPLPVSVIAGNGLILLGECAYVAALQQFITDRPLPRAMRIVCALSVLAMLPLALFDTPMRVFIVSLVTPLPVIWGAWQVWRARDQVERSLWPVGFTLALIPLAFFGRAADAWLHPQAYHDLAVPNTMQVMMLLTSFAALLGAGFGFVLACTERATRSMERLASHDHLTGALNRQAAELMLEHALQRARRERSTVVFVLLDLDRFKLINDLNGHVFGDEVLRRFAQTVRERLRSSDVFARYGGEEFALVLPDSDTAGALGVLDELRRATAEMGLRAPDGRAFVVTFSAGVALSPGGDIDADALYRDADTALYQAKHAGRDRSVLAEPELTGSRPGVPA